jgi:hypothetical protein
MRSSDIIVATPEKSGTTWLQHMAHQLRAGGAEPTFEDQNDVSSVFLLSIHMRLPKGNSTSNLSYVYVCVDYAGIRIS